MTMLNPARLNNSSVGSCRLPLGSPRRRMFFGSDMVGGKGARILAAIFRLARGISRQSSLPFQRGFSKTTAAAETSSAGSFGFTERGQFTIREQKREAMLRRQFERARMSGFGLGIIDHQHRLAVRFELFEEADDVA